MVRYIRWNFRLHKLVILFDALFFSDHRECHHKSHTAKTGFFGLHFYRSDVIDPKCPDFGEITQNSGYYDVQSHSRSPISVPLESLCDFVCVKNSNLIAILHRFRYMVNFWSSSGLWHGGCISLTQSLEVNAYMLDGEIWSSETRSVVQSIIRYLEPFGRGSRVCRTERQTDRLAHCIIALHCVARQKTTDQVTW